jgi:hypothetical protein
VKLRVELWSCCERLWLLLHGLAAFFALHEGGVDVGVDVAPASM